jgi:ribose transport system permease protein
MKLSLLRLLQDRVTTMLITIGLVGIGASIAFPSLFPTFDNFSQILLNVSIDTIVAVGMMILMIAGVFDLSVGSVVALSGGIAAHLMYAHGLPPAVAIAAGVMAAGMVGWVNGWLVAKVGINPMIQTLAMMGVVRGLSLMVSGAGIQIFNDSFNAIGQARVLGFQSPVWFMAVIVLIFSVLVSQTVFFRRYYYIGGNEKAARLSGIQVERMKIYGFMIASLLAGVAGILLCSRLGAAMSTSGKGMELRVITAVILGGASLSGGQGKVVGALLGAFFMGLVSNVMVIARVSGYWQEIILGIILITAVGLDQLIRRRTGRV